MLIRLILLTGAVLGMCGCVVETPGPTQHDSKSIDLGSAEILRVNLKMGAGNLRVHGGSQKEARADFTYNVLSWKPYVRYSSTGSHGDLTIEQPRASHTRIGRTRYEWDVRLTRDVPTDVRVNFGAGDAHLNLSSLKLRSVEVDMGVGKLDLDLRGKPSRSYDVRIRGGVGEAVVWLPSGVGVVAEAEGGLGEVKVSGLRREGRRYYNAAYEDSKVTVHVDVRGGIGAIRLIAD